MKNGKALLLALLFCLGGAFAVVCTRPRSEPVYEGKHASEYFNDLLRGSVPRDRASWALVNLGTNTIPYLRGALQARDSTHRNLLLWLARKQSIVIIQVNTATELHIAGLDGYKKLLEAVNLGMAQTSAADACLSETKELLADADPLTRQMAGDVLQGIRFVKSERVRRIKEAADLSKLQKPIGRGDATGN